MSEEAVEALARRKYALKCEAMGWPETWEQESDGHREIWRQQARDDLAVAAPPIRKQERQRVREALLSDSTLDVATGAAYTQPIASNRREDMRAAFIAALDSLEDE